MQTMKLYHLTDKSSVPHVLHGGIPYGAKGSGSRKPDVAKANNRLDAVRPAHFVAAGVSRTNCLYVCLSLNGYVFDITGDGVLPIADWVAKQSQAVLAADIDPAQAYVSDLDTYDAAMHAITKEAPERLSQEHTEIFWKQVTPLPLVLQQYGISNGSLQRRSAVQKLPLYFRRPEVMVVSSIPAHVLELVKGQ